MRIALLSNVTVEVLAGMLRKEHQLWLPTGFGAWIETALSAPEDLKAFNPEAIFLLLDSSHASYDPSAVGTAVATLESALPQATVIVPDLEDLALELEEDESSTLRLQTSTSTNKTASPFYDERMWQLGSMPWSMKGLRAIKDEINRLIRAMKGERKKVLALDFDNTLWQGVIGEDGVAGIQPFVDFQREIKALRERGVLLVALTKNNVADVEPIWNDPRMVLKREDFVDLRVDWNDKPANLTASAKALNIGSDSFVFVDDNPVERAQMAAMHPEVVVPDWPVSIRRLARLYFPKLRITDEDRQKTEQYHAEAQRKELAATLSVEDYLASLEIRTEIHPILESEFPRVAQLSQKTNQFNVCTNRYTVDDIARFAADPNHLLVTLHASDKFGDQGLVAFVHAAESKSVVESKSKVEVEERIDSPSLEAKSKKEDVNHSTLRLGLQTSTKTYEVLDWVMSCRVMNRRIEFTVEQWLENALKKRGVTKLLATWRPTMKNAPVKDLFEKFNFVLTQQTEKEKNYERVLV